MIKKKPSNYQELYVPEWDFPLSKLKDFVERAERAGHNAVDLTVDSGPYGEIDGFNFCSRFSEMIAARESEPPTP